MSKKLLVLLVLVMLVVPFASVNAQSMNEGIDYCQIMDSADCQILVDSAVAMSTVSSFAFDMSMNYDMAMEGDGAAGFDNMNFGFAGNGLIALDVEVFSNIQTLAMADPQAYLAQMPTLMDDMFTGIDGEAYFVLTLPDMFGQMIGTTEIPLNLLMKDGQYIIDVKSLADAVGEDANGLEWAGIDMNGAFASMLGDFDMSSFIPADQFDAMTMDMSVLGEAMTITRLADSEVNGVSVYVFETVLDYGALLDAMGMSEMLESMYLEMGLSPAEIEASLSMLSGIEVIINQYIGMDDLYTHRSEVALDFAMDGEMMGEPGLDSMSIGFDMVMTMSDFNSPVDIEFPSDAMIMPFTSMMAGF